MVLCRYKKVQIQYLIILTSKISELRPNRNAFAVRYYFADYSLGEGSVPWQNEYVCEMK
jgi:hypothetical protein